LLAPDVAEVEVRLHPQRAVITISKSVDATMLQASFANQGHLQSKNLIQISTSASVNDVTIIVKCVTREAI
jgi:hypothetical protein